MTMQDELEVPKVEVEGLGYLITWDDGVQMLMERLYDHSDYHIDAELTVSDTHQLNPHLLGPVRTSITKTFRTVVSDLDDVAQGRNWKGRLKQASYYVLQEHRKGQPVVKLSDMEAPERPPERITGIAFEGMPTLIFGDGGMGKSTLAVAMLTMVQAGVPVGDSFKVVQGNCLVLDYEASWEETWRRNADVIRGSNLPKESMVHYRFCSAPLATEVNDLRHVIRDLNISVVLVDSAGPACGGEPENAQNTLQYFAALRSLSDFDRPVTTITLAHVSKGQGGRNGPFGSVYWTNLPRNTFELKKSQKRGSDYIDLALHHRKTNIGQLREPLGLRMTWENGITLEPLDIKAHAGLGNGGYGERAELALRNPANIDGLTLEELAEEMGVENEKSLSATLSRDGRFKSDNGYWKLDLDY
tara:strand:- start:10477 stop:11721 length:1245 start_codon:yes stop_codon:yes gene_type:complete